MDSNFYSLPPLKRFRLLQLENEKHQISQSDPKPKPEPETKTLHLSSPSNLPAKKRLKPEFDTTTPPLSPFNLPVKKRLKPELNMTTPPLSPSSLPAKKRKVPELDMNTLPLSPSNLPTKKRKQSLDSFLELDFEKENIPPPPPPPTLYSLPAKKRIWAIKPPEFSPIKSPTPSPCFDLNLEYDPSLELRDEGSQNEELSIEVEIETKEDGEEGEEGDDGILCAVCESTDGDPSDPIVFCDGCDLMVHSTCYGNPLVKGIPEGDWLCAQCLNSQPSAHKCCLCPVLGGAMKPTNDGRWAHIVCAVLVPEVFFEDPEGRNGIDCSRVPKRRWKGKCYVCNERKGCAIECSEPKCPLGFHVTCGLKKDLCIELKEGKNSGGIVAGFCKKHTELWKKQKQTGKFKIVARDEEQKC